MQSWINLSRFLPRLFSLSLNRTMARTISLKTGVLTTLLVVSFIGVLQAATYKVKPGDTLFTIAERHGVSLDDVSKANPSIKNINVIFPGQTITIPEKIVEEDSSVDISEEAPKKPPKGVSKPESKEEGESKESDESNNVSHADTIISEPTEEPSPEDRMENDLIGLVNRARKKNKLQLLTRNKGLSRVAKKISEDMLASKDAIPKYTSPKKLLKEHGLNFRFFVENTGNGQAGTTDVFDAWMGSGIHRRQMLSPNYTETGVGYVAGGRFGHYWTQVFAG